MKRLLTAAACLMGLALTGQAVAAHADPNPPTDFRTYVCVTDGATAHLWDGLSNGNPAAGIAPAIAGVGCWDGDGATPFRPRTRPATTIPRPLNSLSILRLLSRSWDPEDHLFRGVNVAGLVDFVSVAAQPPVPCQPTDPTCALMFLPLGRDAISVAVQTGQGAGVPVNVTRAQLAAAYACTGPATATLTDGTSLPLTPTLPQVDSTTRSAFLKMIGVATPGACVGTRGAENDGSQIPAVGEMIPFSAAQYIAQANGVIPDQTGGATLAGIDGKQAVMGARPSLSAGPLFGSSCFGGVCAAPPAPAAGDYFARDVYDVMLANPTYPSPKTGALTTFPSAIVRGGDLNEKLASAAGQTAILNRYGFASLSYAGSSRNFLYSKFVPGNS